MRIGILDHDIDALRHRLAIAGRCDQTSILGLDIAEHDHAVAKRELGMGDPAAIGRHHHLPLKAEGRAEPVDRRGSVAVAQGRNDPASVDIPLLQTSRPPRTCPHCILGASQS